MERDMMTPEEHMKQVIAAFDDADREGLKETPRRYIKFLKEFLTPEDFNMTTFDGEGIDTMILQLNIPFYSLCEHHLAPFFGTAAVAYIPQGRIVGLSKLARVVDLYARRFQNQERITRQIAERLQSELNAGGVAVSITAQHLCMAMRGVKKHNTHTTTNVLTGVFRDSAAARSEFFDAVNARTR